MLGNNSPHPVWLSQNEGNRSQTGLPTEVFSDGEIDVLMGFADAAAASLRTAVLLRHLKGQLRALENEG